MNKAEILAEKERCAYCQRPATTKDHIIPRKLVGGKLGIANVVHACRSCNALKADMIPSEMRDTAKEMKLVAKKLAAIADRVDGMIAARALKGGRP